MIELQKVGVTDEFQFNWKGRHFVLEIIRRDTGDLVDMTMGADGYGAIEHVPVDLLKSVMEAIEANGR